MASESRPGACGAASRVSNDREEVNQMADDDEFESESGGGGFGRGLLVGAGRGPVGGAVPAPAPGRPPGESLRARPIALGRTARRVAREPPDRSRRRSTQA